MSAAAQFDPDAFMASRKPGAAPSPAPFDPDAFMASRQSPAPNQSIRDRQIVLPSGEPGSFAQQHPLAAKLITALGSGLPGPVPMDVMIPGSPGFEGQGARLAQRALPEIGSAARKVFTNLPHGRDLLAIYDTLGNWLEDARLTALGETKGDQPVPQAPSGSLQINTAAKPAQAPIGVSVPLRPPMQTSSGIPSELSIPVAARGVNVPLRPPMAQPADIPEPAAPSILNINDLPEAWRPQPATDKLPTQKLERQTPGQIATAANAAAKADRFVQGVIRMNRDQPQVAITSEDLAGAGDAEKSMLTRALKAGGYVKNTETVSDLSWPYILSKLRQAELRAPIRPPAGFSMGDMNNYWSTSNSTISDLMRGK